MKNYIILIVFSIMTACISKQEKRQNITSKEDYAKYILQKSIKTDLILAKYDKEAVFWTGKIKDRPNGYLYIQKLAAIRAEQFELTGNVDHLLTSDSLFLIAADMVSGKHKASNLLSLSSNAIKKHQFQQALDYCFMAIGLTNDKYGPLMMMYDAYMELGNYELAGTILKQNKRMDDFHYLVRLSKYQDHTGNLDSAISLMEMAYAMVDGENKGTSIWSLANLGDMYGHAGRLEESYKAYLKVLDKDPEYLHALKGIAWLAYSNDNKTEEAKAILNFINKQSLLPDGHLMLAEIAEYTDRPVEKAVHHKIFIREAAKPKYLGMYNKYLISLYSEVFMDYERAITLAKQEVNSRPTPMTYALLAWTYDQKGEHKQALDIISKHVEDKIYEPEAIYYIGMIYAENGKTEKAKDYLKQAGEAAFELGPVVSMRIKEKLNNL